MWSITESLSYTSSFTSFTHSLSKKPITGANKNMQFSTRNSRWGQWTVILIWFYFVLKKPVSQRHRELIKQAAEIIENSLYKHHSMWQDINQLGGEPDWKLHSKDKSSKNAHLFLLTGISWNAHTPYQTEKIQQRSQETVWIDNLISEQSAQVLLLTLSVLLMVSLLRSTFVFYLWMEAWVRTLASPRL